ncbi:tetratricopeptide repeat protein [Mucilaginibacter sp.]|uniref:tetratricopeptide repeat protein n=1 Tax=Mucilaginibacter sp. TaxID=1882438 RepID=UPI0026133787|nr:tetratricopeptide repeat protein [Mucilaginibacter sp.]MDB5032621.1 tetratricopeptide repeat protein [Mucilaginibacter sp.]
MKRILVLVFFAILSCTKLFAQSDELQLAKQYYANGEHEKALTIYQKLYKQDNDTYYNSYVAALMSLKKFDEAEIATKKIMRKHPNAAEYTITLGSIYIQRGDTEKANALYNGLIKSLPADQNVIASLAAQFYQGTNADFAIKTFQQGRKLLHNDDLFTYELITLYRFKRNKPELTEEYLNILPKNPLFLSQAENTFSTLFEGEADYDMLRIALLKRIQKDPQQTVFVNLLTWQFLQQKDFGQALNQALALSRRTNSDGSDIYDLCRTLIANEAYDEAIRGYEYLISMGKDQPLYADARIELINTKNLKVTAGKYVQNDLVDLEKNYIDLIAEFGRNNTTASAMQKLANLQTFKLHKLNEAQKILEDAINITEIRPNLRAACKLDLGDIYLLNNQPWEATLLYSQVEKEYPNTAIGQDAKFRNAKFAYYTGDFTWAKGQLDVLKAATSQLIANDALNLSLLIADNIAVDTSGKALQMYAHADLQIFAEQQDKAIKILDSINIKYPNNALSDDILMAKARIAIQQKNFADAAADLKKIVAEHPTDLWADDAVFMLGDIYENQLTDKEQAKNYYQKIITDYGGSLFINEARKRFRKLRGDKTDGL